MSVPKIGTEFFFLVVCTKFYGILKALILPFTVGMSFQKFLEDKTSVGDICRWVQNIICTKAGMKSEPGIDWYSSGKDLHEVVDLCDKFFRTWTSIGEKIFQNIQPQQYPSSK